MEDRFGDSGVGGLATVEGRSVGAAASSGGCTAPSSPFSPFFCPVGVFGWPFGAAASAVAGRDGGGESGGGGMFVPSVSEKFTTLSESGWNLLGMLVERAWSAQLEMVVAPM